MTRGSAIAERPCCTVLYIHGGAENAGLENAGVAKMQEWKTRDWKMQESEKYGKRRFQKCVSDCTD